MTADEALATEIETALSELTSFVCSPAMEGVMQEFSSLPEEHRAQYVLDVLLDTEELKKRGVNVPPGVIIQRSAFRDNRRTLFCATKYLPPGLGWKKVTVTFDNPSGKPALSFSEFEASKQGTDTGGSFRVS
ncbi:hypothetical protein [Streptomyces sp. SLBN-118]|uniref:hypothetical protein n=1 Tax=Streptomyces sp. SLBN-118 TaxID=2768454 RepID=UPI001153CC00|nr:hypothetical protein [Streptomyces sp. SLBN-118]